jgi:hypothetical protein
VVVAPSKYVYGTPITDWTSYTPTGGWTGGNVSYVGKRRRVGDSLEASVQVVLTGAPTGTNLTIDLPPGLSIDTAKVNTTTAQITPLGKALIRDTGVANYPADVTYESSTTVSIRTLTSAANIPYNTAIVSATSPITFGNTDNVLLEYRVPILGWSSSVQMSDNADSRILSFKAYRGTSQSSVNPNGTSVKINLDTVSHDTHGAFSTANNRFVAPVSGYYVFTGCITISPGTNVLANNYQVVFAKNGTAGTESYQRFVAVAGTAFVVDATSLPILMNAGDYMELFFFGQGNNSASTLTALGDAGSSTWMAGHRISGPSAIGATETIAARYYASATAVTGSLATVSWTTKDFDTHSAMSAGTFTVPATGKYQVNTALALAGTYALNTNVTFQIQKNGTAVSTFSFYAAAAITAVDPVISDIISCVAGDTIRVQVSSGATTPTIVSSNDRNWFSISRLGL